MTYPSGPRPGAVSTVRAVTLGALIVTGPTVAGAQVVDSTAVDSTGLGVVVDSTLAGADTLAFDSLARVMALPPEIIDHLESITTSSFETPFQMGLLPTGMVEAAIASEYVSVAGSDSLDVGRMTRNMVHVLHAIDPSLVGGGLGLGYGFRRAAGGVRQAARLAASAPGASDVLLYHASFIEDAANGALARADEAVAVARSIRSSSDPEAIRPLLDRLAGLVRAMAYGFDADRDGRIGHTAAESGLAQAAYHLALVRRVEGLAPAPPLPAGLPLPASLIVPGYARGGTGLGR